MAKRGRSARRKGAAGELEFFKLLNRYLPERLRIQRNLGQARDAGADGSPVGVEVEVKRQEKLRLGPWLEQVRTAASLREKIPVLAYRQNNGPWHCLVDLDPLQLASFIRWREEMEKQEQEVKDSLTRNWREGTIWELNGKKEPD